MPTIDLTDKEHAALTAAARQTLHQDRFSHSPRLDPLKSALAKLDPASAPKPVEPRPPSGPRSEDGDRMPAKQPQDARRRKSQLWWFLTSIVALIVIASRAWWFYDNFLKHDEPPIEVGDDAFGTGQMVDMYADAKVAQQQFNETYRGKPFAASGTFNYAEQDYSRYEISLLVYAYFVNCRTSDAATVTLAKQLIAGFPVKVSGLIDYMDDRTLHLSRCALHRPRPGCDTWGAQCSDP